MQKYNAKLIINLNAIQENYTHLARISKPATCAAVIKADAYGTGSEHVAPALHEKGCTTFFTAFIQEAETIRKILPNATLYTLNGLNHNKPNDFHAHNIRPVLSHIEDIQQWAQFTKNTHNPIPAAIHVDTGMNRLGLDKKDFLKLIENKTIPNQFPISLIMSHFACADNPAHHMNQKQKQNFDTIIRHIPKIPASLANSYALMSNANTHYNLTRPGIALHGGTAKNTQNPLYIPKNAITLTTRIAQIRTLNAGETVGYGAQWQADKNTTIAVIPVGYADGYPRSLSQSNSPKNNQGNGYVTINKHKAPIIGRISMDMTTIDISHIPISTITPKTEVELIGNTIPIDTIARNANTIEYEILTQLGKRFQRQYALTSEHHNATQST